MKTSVVKNRILERVRDRVGPIGWGLAVALLASAPAVAQKSYFPIMMDEPMVYPIEAAYCSEAPEAPIMDGRIDDACWQAVAPLGDFILNENRAKTIGGPKGPARAAKHQTHVKLLRVENMLYIAFEALEPEMEKVRAEAYYHDEERICFDDRIIVFIDPNHDHQNVYEFAINTRAATLERSISRTVPYAMSHILGPVEWNTEWFGRVRKLDDRWTGEICIAMDRLLKRPIQPGDTVGFNVCRDRLPIWRFGPTGQKFVYPQECSAWSYAFNHHSGSMTVGNWYEPIMFGDLVFAPKEIEVTQIAFYQSTATYNGLNWHRPQTWGDNPLQVTLRNSGPQSRKLTLEVTSQGLDQPLTRTTDVLLPAGAVQTAVAPIAIRGQDHQPFTLVVRDAADGQPLYRTSYSTRVPPFVEFDLTSVYVPADKATGGILFTPVARPGALQGLTLKMSLCPSGEKTVLVSRTVTALEASVDFAEAFPGFNLTSLTPGNYEIHCELMGTGGAVEGRYTQLFTRPLPAGSPAFGAHDGQYAFAGETGRAVVIKFPNAHDYVFWERSSYAPWWDVSGVGVAYEFIECWGYGNMGCSEPMQDKENRFSRVDVVESSPARAVVHWRYALTDPNYRIFRDEWVDEYYVFYPDAVGVRQVNLWANSDVKHEFIQPQYVMSPGVLPGQVFERQPCRVFNLAGEEVFDDLDTPSSEKPVKLDFDQWPEGVMRIKLKDRSHPFYTWVRREDVWPRIVNIFPPWQGAGADVRYNLGAHWPMTKLNVDVYNIASNNKAYHTWSGPVQAKADLENLPNTWSHIVGITDRDDQFLGDVAASWGYPADLVVDGAGWHGNGFDFKQRAFLVQDAGSGSSSICRLHLEGGKRPEVFNPVFMLKTARTAIKRISLNGTEVASDAYRAAPTRQAGEIVLWIGQNVPTGAVLEIEFQK